MLLDVLARELVPVWAFTQANLLCFLFGIFDRPAVTQGPPDHPERSDANRGGAVDKRGTILGIVSDLQKLRDLILVWITKDDGNVEIAQSQFFRFCFFFRRAVLARLAQIDDRLDTFGF